LAAKTFNSQFVNYSKINLKFESRKERIGSTTEKAQDIAIPIGEKNKS
jgi:hypothetical protein